MMRYMEDRDFGIKDEDGEYILEMIRVSNSYV